jgi:hypothetical protein
MELFDEKKPEVENLMAGSFNTKHMLLKEGETYYTVSNLKGL